MDEFKNNILDMVEHLHMKVHHQRFVDEEDVYSWGEGGRYQEFKDYIKLETLKEVVQANPYWDAEKLSLELGERIRKRTTFN